MQGSSGVYEHGVRGESAWLTLLDELDESGRHVAKIKGRRGSFRWSYRRGGVSLAAELADGSEVERTGTTRNISAGGVAVLLLAELPCGTRVRLTLDAEEGPAELPGTIVRCTPVRPGVCEVGVAFDEAIDPQRFLRGGEELGGLPSIPENLTGLRGNVLHVDAQEVDRLIVERHLADTGLRIKGVESGERALATLEGRVDLLILDYHLPGAKGPDVLKALRRARIKAPAVLLTGDVSRVIGKRLAEAQADAILYKPVDRDRLLRTIMDLLGWAGGDGRAQSTLARDSRAYPLLGTFVAALAEEADKLEAAARSGDTAEAIGACRRVRGNASMFGFEALGLEAERCQRLLEAGGLGGEGLRSATRLVAAMRQAKPPREESAA